MHGGTAEKAELESNLCRDGGVECKFAEHHKAEDVYCIDFAVEEFSEDPEFGSEPAAHCGGARADKEKIGGECDGDDPESFAVREKKSAEDVEERCNERKVKSGDGKEVL